MQHFNQTELPTNKKGKFTFGVHPAVRRIQIWISTLQEKTGRTLEEWVDLVQRSKLKTRAERKKWLKEEFELGSMDVALIVERAEGQGWGDGDPAAYLEAAQGYVDAMFAGPKAGLLPIYESILSISYNLGKDVKACPCKTIVPLYRNHVFAEIKPTTRNRIDLGLALGGMRMSSRLISTGGYEKKDRITYRIPLTSLSEIDDEVRHWLKVAYDLDA
ncbi:MAG: hypothetical protein BGO68_01925 [Candidatus Amoebophilus sp. 36-38]|nr:MAG: hypothetical protein BGO68_01925 [Candidatus Amoebophilus sp. 36-38]